MPPLEAAVVSVLYPITSVTLFPPPPGCPVGTRDALMLRGGACPYAHTRFFGAPGSHGV